MFHVVASYRANPAMMAPSKRNCRIAQRIARTPKRARGAHTFSLCSRNVTVWQVRSQRIQRRIVPPDPHGDPGLRARRSPPPARARGLVRSPHNPGSQHSDHRTLCRAPDHTHAEQQQPDGNTLQVDKQITLITTIKRHRVAAGRVRHRPGPLKTAGVEVRSSSRTSASTRNPRPTPGNPHSTQRSPWSQLPSRVDQDGPHAQPGAAHVRV